MNFQLPVPNMSQFAFIFLITLNVAIESYSEQNNILLGGGVPLAGFSMLHTLLFALCFQD